MEAEEVEVEEKKWRHDDDRRAHVRWRVWSRGEHAAPYDSWLPSRLPLLSIYALIPRPANVYYYIRSTKHDTALIVIANTIFINNFLLPRLGGEEEEKKF